jgi:organic hydroperoxide reductase OsmC/OhrA
MVDSTSSFRRPATRVTAPTPSGCFAAGWSACFLSAIKLVAGKKKVSLAAELRAAFKSLR